MSAESVLDKDHPFYQGLREGQLLYLRCDACDWVLPYGAGLCPRCPEAAVRWVSSIGRGRVRAQATYHRSYRENLPAPYGVVVVQLDEGPRLLGRLSAAVTPVSAGTRVRAQIDCDELELVFVEE